jgi:hypothetical protein
MKINQNQNDDAGAVVPIRNMPIGKGRNNGA